MACAWIHCNICLRLPSANIRYFISNCGHIACDRCVGKKLLTPKCTICKRDAKIEEINKDLREDLRKYFVNIHDFAIKSFNEIKAIIDFQSKNCRRLMKHKVEKIQELQSTTIKHSEDAATIAKLEAQVKELQARNAILENENQTLNSSFTNQQALVNQLITNNGASANNTMNNAPSFFQSSFNANNITQQDLFSLINASYLNASLARSDSSSTLSTKTTHSAPSRSTLFKPSLSANPGSNLRTPQGRSQMPQSQRSRTVCPHWPKARCRCNK